MKHSTLTMALSASLLLCSSAFAQEVKDPNPPAVESGNAVTTVFGPDAFGYIGYDEAEPECTLQFVDISATGASVLVGDDTGTPVNLPGPAFNFYGTLVTDLAATSNGYLATDVTDTGPDLSNDCPLPFAPSTGGGARIYPLHDDLNLVAGTGQLFFEYFAACPRPSGWGGAEGCYIFQWDGVQHFGGTDAWTFQAILYDTSFGIVFQHGAGNPEAGSGSTTGIQNDGATIGLTYACDTPASVPDNSAQCIYHPDFLFGDGAGGDLSITLADAPDPVTAGENLTYTAVATNNGPNPVDDVSITLPLPAGTSFVSATASAGGSCNAVSPVVCSWPGATADGASVTATIVALVAPSAIGPLSATATAATTSNDTDPTNNTATATTAVGASADVALTLSSNAGALEVGDQFNFIVTGTNNGPSDASGVLFTLTLNEKLSFVGSDCGATVAGNVVSWSVPTLAAGASFTCNVTVAVVLGGDLSATAAVSTVSVDPDLSNNSASLVIGTGVVPVPSLSHLGLLLLALLLAGGGLWVVRRG